MHIANGSEFYLRTFEGVDFGDQTLASCTFESCTFIRCLFTEAVLNDCKFIECSFQSCELSNAKLTSSKFRTTSFDECKLLGVDWTRASWPRYSSPGKLCFRKSNISYSNFFGLELQETVLEECKAHHVDFREADFTKSNFSYTDFSASLFGKTRLASVDFSEATRYLIDVQNNEVRGGRFTRSESFGLLYGLDIELVD
jgi:uncharacterized protein YjbI with pentapeptide repeats